MLGKISLVLVSYETKWMGGTTSLLWYEVVLQIVYWQRFKRGLCNLFFANH